MATSYKVLGQVAPSATTDTTLYTSPAGTQTVISTIVVANLSSTETPLYRIAVRPGGETLANKHYLAYDVPIGITDSTTITLGITMAAGDVLTVRSTTANLVFNAFGSQIS
jgi:hypothetical protein